MLVWISLWKKRKLMTNNFIQHIPGFVSGTEPKSFDFDTLDELLNHEVVKQWRMDPFNVGMSAPKGWFYRYSLSEHRLMAELKHGKEWYVIGYIKHPDKVELPEWEYPNES